MNLYLLDDNMRIVLPPVKSSAVKCCLIRMEMDLTTYLICLTVILLMLLEGHFTKLLENMHMAFLSSLWTVVLSLTSRHRSLCVYLIYCTVIDGIDTHQ